MVDFCSGYLTPSLQNLLIRRRVQRNNCSDQEKSANGLHENIPVSRSQRRSLRPNKQEQIANLTTQLTTIQNPWTVFTPGWIGFSEAPSNVQAFYKVIGTTCIISLTSTHGTSNSNSFVMTGLPVLVTQTHSLRIPLTRAFDNSIQVYNADAYLSSPGSTLLFIKAGSSLGWTTSGGKSVDLNFFYETA